LLAPTIPLHRDFRQPPDEIVAIGRDLAGKERLTVDDAEWDLLAAAATQLRAIPYESGTMLDVAGNGR
jgi:hypothetical protein